VPSAGNAVVLIVEEPIVTPVTVVVKMLAVEALLEAIVGEPKFRFSAAPVVTEPVVVRLVPVAAPIDGVVSVGDVANTRAPDPVSSEITPANCAEVVAANWFRPDAVKPRPVVACTWSARAAVVAVPTAAVPRAAGVVELSPVMLLNEVPVIAPAANPPEASRKTIVEAPFAVAGLKPSSMSAFRFVTSVVEDTVNGAVPVAIVEVNTLFVEIAPSTVIGVLNKRAIS
jgi:hypothetical protein